MKRITDTQIVDWLEKNVGDLVITRTCPKWEYTQAGFPLPDNRELVFQRKIRVGRGGQNIWSEREYFSLREMATEALQQK